MALTLYRMKTDGRLEKLHAMQQRGYFMVHDVAITPNYAVFVIPPVTFDIFRLMSGRIAPIALVALRPAASTVMLRPLSTPVHQISERWPSG